MRYSSWRPVGGPPRTPTGRPRRWGGSSAVVGGEAGGMNRVWLRVPSSNDGISWDGGARDAVPLDAGWWGSGGALGVYRTEIEGNLKTILQRTALAWPIAAIVGLVFRYLVIGHGLEASFVIVTILINLVMLLLWRAAYALAPPPKPGGAPS